jgi:FHA domain
MNMPWYELSLTRLEARLRALIEGEPGVDGITSKLHKQLEHKLVTAMLSSVHSLTIGDLSGSQKLKAPDIYTLVLPTDLAQQLLTHPAEIDRLTRALAAAATRSGILFARETTLRVVAEPKATEIKIRVEYSQVGKGDSHTTEVDDGVGQSSHIAAGMVPRAFLIVNGLTTYPLTEPVVNIGRDPSNQVHLEDLRVSRMHAQLRLIQGQFVIFDLDSMGGTFVNDVAVSSHLLNPGDVIHLAGVPLVYGLEEDIPSGFTQELPADPPPPEVL